MTRLRTARPGYDAQDPALDPRFLSFDSQWLNSFRLVESAAIPAAWLPDGYVSDGGMGSIPYSDYRFLQISISTANRAFFATNRRGGGSRSFSDPSGGPTNPVAYAQSYFSRYVVMMGDHIRLPRPSDEAVPPGDILYWAFQSTPTAPEPTGPNGVLYGNHAALGPGLYISRPGVADPLTAADGDLVLASTRNYFQIAETGTAGPAGLYSFAHAAWTTIVTLSNSYPSYPPVMYYCPNARVGDTGTGALRIREPTCYWLSPNQLAFTHQEPSTAPGGGGGFYVRFAIIASDPAYAGGSDSGSFLRCYASPATGFGVTKKNVHATSAGAEDWLFRSDRASFHFNGFDDIGLGRASAVYTSPVATAGLPFSFFTMPDVSLVTELGTLCGVGAIGSTHWRGPEAVGSGSIASRMRYLAQTINGSQYYWWQDGTFPGGTAGKLATVNVSDF